MLAPRWLAYVAIAVAAVVAIGCGPSTPPGLSIANGTTLTVTLLVNGTVVGTFAPGVERDPIPATDLPALPWNVEACSPSGRVLTSMGRERLPCFVAVRRLPHVLRISQPSRLSGRLGIDGDPHPLDVG